nr:hypothetical protein Iba_chr13bCG2780 [Ipomoea batatas]GMD77359.1 hypothetical protein Iba_chr13cCG2560 [Ipomoea batatas]
MLHKWYYWNTEGSCVDPCKLGCKCSGFESLSQYAFHRYIHLISPSSTHI